MNKKGQKTAEKMFRPVFGCCKHPKAGQNTQQISVSISAVPFQANCTWDAKHGGYLIIPICTYA